MKKNFAFALVIWCASQAAAQGETYRCSMDREIAVGANGLFEDNKEANKGTEFYLAIDNKTQQGTVSVCKEGNCGNAGEIHIVTRWESESVTKNQMVRMLTGATGQLGRLWSLERWWYDEVFNAIAVSALGQRSDTGFGTCQMVIQ